jgi:transposase
LPDPAHLAILSRPVVVRAASRPTERLLGQAALSFSVLLRQATAGGLPPPSGKDRASWRTWIYQQLIDGYAQPDPTRGKTLLTGVIERLRTRVPAGLEELTTLGRTLYRRRTDILAYFEHQASNGPTEAINGRLEALRRSALGFRNLVNYTFRCLLHCGNLAQVLDAL